MLDDLKLKRQQSFGATDMLNGSLFPSFFFENEIISDGRTYTRTASGEKHDNPHLSVAGYKNCISVTHSSGVTRTCVC